MTIKAQYFFDAKCKDCEFRKDFYHGRKKESRCMVENQDGKPGITDVRVTLRTGACTKFKLA